MKRRFKVFAWTMLFCMVYQLVFPAAAYALTGGPSQPEVESFEPVGTSEMVDVFTGDFNYNIPLMEVDGYPINLAYHSGITMDQEASWVGLGWNINPGVMNRNMRGIPDDFNGDEITKFQYIKPNKTYGIEVSRGMEVYGAGVKGSASKSTDIFSIGINYNNYTGLGVSSKITPVIEGLNLFKDLVYIQPSISLESNSKTGSTINSSLSLFIGDKSGHLNIGTSVSTSINSRAGIKQLQLSYQASAQVSDKLEENPSLRYSSTLNYATQTYTPSIGIAMNNTSATLSDRFGPTFYGINPNLEIAGSYAEQSVAEVKAQRKAFGNLYSHFKEDENSILDFNREKDGEFSEENPSLAIPVYTHDIYYASGQGIGGTFTAKRNDVPVLTDPKVNNISNGYTIDDLEIGFGNLIKVGANLTYNYSSVRSGMWGKNNNLMKKMGFRTEVTNHPKYEPVYFKNVGEKTALPSSDYLQYQNINNGALSPLLEDKGRGIISTKESITSENKLFDVKGQQIDITNANTIRKERSKRNTFMSYKTQGERKHCLNENIKYYNLRNPNNANEVISAHQRWAETQQINSGTHKSQHLAEIAISQSDGSRYIYGIPAYNTKQYEITFTNALDPVNGSNNDASFRLTNCATGETNYKDDFDPISPTISQLKDRANKGINHGFNSTYIPAYAHSYLLTDVLSADYVDMTEDGPTRDDHGSYTKISYYKASSSFKWRVPYNAQKATFNENLKSDPNDDEANIIYGEKELWYTAKIEGKNHYAIFHLSERRDGHGVASVHGGASTANENKSYKLDKIELYAFNQGPNEAPIQTVHFVYDYTLCPQTDNSVYHNTENPNRGKLTLKEVYFTYGTSQKGRLNSYRFNYNNLNPSYNLKGYDRWGNYKPNPVITANGIDCNRTSNAEFPYVNQDKATADSYASAWHLSSIDLPSGGSINITYEADDYAYVQDKQAMQMAKIRGFADYDNLLFTPNTDVDDIPVKNTLYNQEDPTECILIDLPPSMLEMSPEIIKQNLLSGQNNLVYYNCLVNLTPSDDPNTHYEYIRGYGEVEDVGVINMQGTYPVAWIKLKTKDNGKNHPISLSSWQFTRLYQPYLIYPGSDLMKNDNGSAYTEAVIRGLFGFLFDGIDMLVGVYNKMRRKSYGQTVNVNKSWVRINNLTGYKYGGGSRVKRLSMSNNWNALSGSGITESYGQEYDYTTKEMYNGAERVISSGVAAYEPIIGGDENVWRQPIAYEIDNIGVPNNRFYSETPFGESYFPAASVGYSRVSVKSITPTNVNAGNHGTGKEVFEYYTAKDFPVITSYTELAAKQYKNSALFAILGIINDENMTMAQGFQVELNDMHGKLKSKLNYTQAKMNSYDEGEAFSGIRHTYLTETDNNGITRLKNEYQVVNRLNQISNATVGLESDIFMDSRQQESEQYAFGLGINIEITLYSLFPAIVPSSFPTYHSNNQSYQSSVLMRVINRSGLLVKTEAFEEGSSVSTENVLLDGETGEVLLTKTYNEYKDPLYNFTMPAHWVYDGMGGAYQNEGLTINVMANPSNYSAFVVSSGNTEDYFSDGDEIQISNYAYANPNERYYVHKKQRNGLNEWYVLKNNGHRVIIDGPATFKIMKSGRKNMQTVPVMAVSSMNNPVSGTSLVFNNNSNVLNAAAITFSDDWRMPSEMTKTCDYELYKEEVIAILNYLLQSGQITAANYNDHIKPSPDYFLSSTPITISTTANGHVAYTASRIKTQYDACNAPGKVYTDYSYNPPQAPGTSTAPNFTRRFGIEFIVPSSCNVLAGNFYLNGDINTLLGFADNNPNNQIIPTSIELLESVNSVISSVLVNYIDGNGNPQSRIAEGNFENPRLNETTCNCRERTKHTVNIFHQGIKGQWRKQKDWVYYGERKKPTVTNLRKDGAYQTFASFWKQPGNGEQFWRTNTTTNDANVANWTWTNEVTKYNYEGQELENRNPLNIYSAAIYSNRIKNASLAVATNAGYNQIGVENLEDNYNIDNSCPYNNLSFNLQYNSIVETEHHTGKYSIMLNNTSPSTQALYPITTDDGVYDNGPNDTKVDQNYLNGLFNPKPGKYVIGGWIKVSNKPKAASYYENANSARITVEVTGSSGTTTVHCYPQGQIIDGWQRVEGNFTVAANTTSVKFILNTDASNTTYFDDLRVHPFDAKMKTYVYDYTTNRLKAELDENNYATLYEYNAEGQLIRVKKETEKGIVTLKEVRGNQHKINPAN